MAFKVDFGSSGSSAAAAAPAVLRIHIAGWKTCGFYQRTKTVLQSLQTLFPDKYEVVVHESASRDDYRATMPAVREQFLNSKAQNHTSSPFVCTGDDLMGAPAACTYLGGADDTMAWARGLFNGGPAAVPGARAETKLVPDGYAPGHGYDFDLIVIGGGSGGLAASKEAARLGAKVAVLDFVKPSPQGSTWGLGGTCVNVGCIPKKLMHQSSILGELIKHDAPHFGWVASGGGAAAAPEVRHDWVVMKDEVQRYIKSLNFQYRVALRDANVKYINGLGEFESPHAVKVTEFKGKAKTPSSKTLTAARFLIAVGGRPTNLSCPGAEFAITSDDLFSLPASPGKSLLVGAGYVALECAGFLTALGCDTTVLCRSMLLRGFDRECCDKIGAYMEQQGTHIKKGLTPASIAKQGDGTLLVTFSDGSSDAFDTVVAAVGRTADTAGLNLGTCGVEASSSNGKLETTLEQTNVPHMYAIGDVLQGKPELTPVAIQAGVLLAQRLFGAHQGYSGEAMDYTNVATAVFTPLEYGGVGLSEEEAMASFGASSDSVEVFHGSFAPLEWSLSHERQVDTFPAFAKIICSKPDLKVLGMHYLGPNAGEVIQGYAVAMRKGVTYHDINQTVGIHPTTSEQFTTIKITKSSGEDSSAGGC